MQAHNSPCSRETLFASSVTAIIKPDLNISFVGPYQPSTFSFGGHAKGVKPADLAAWESPVMPARKAD
jgi:hypothetical protein